MSRNTHNTRVVERTVIALWIVLLLFLSPVSQIWAALDAPWYSPYLVWAIAIAISWYLQRDINRHEF